MKMKKTNRPIEESYPTIVLQFRAGNNSGLPPEITDTPADLTAKLAFVVGAICEQNGIDCDVSYGMTSVAKATKLGDEMANDDRPPY